MELFRLPMCALRQFRLVAALCFSDTTLCLTWLIFYNAVCVPNLLSMKHAFHVKHVVSFIVKHIQNCRFRFVFRLGYFIPSVNVSRETFFT